MRQFNKLKGTKGFITIWERVIRFRYMITEQVHPLEKSSRKVYNYSTRI